MVRLPALRSSEGKADTTFGSDTRRMWVGTLAIVLLGAIGALLVARFSGTAKKVYRVNLN